MGICYYYVNETKEQWFGIDPTGGLHSSLIGYNFGSQAFGLLILANEPEHTGYVEHPLIGSWIGDRFYITGDDYDENLQAIWDRYTDVGPDIIDMMSVITPYDFYRCGGVMWLCHFGRESKFLTETVRRRLLKFFRGLNNDRPSEDYAKIVDALRPKPPPETDAG